MMSQEAQVVFDLGDVESIQFKCKCGAAVSLSPDGPMEVSQDNKQIVALPPSRCPQCYSLWFSDNRKVHEFLNSVKEIRGYQGDVRIRFAIIRP
jgi:hypothetical protein